MVDRTDIDALLISALYGELTPADEARLTTHLESHPADRTALDDLTRTRAAVRDSRLFAVQLEPPQAVSAMLLREAARRAPRAEREDGSWFLRLLRSFTAHPAMAAAAMLVLVVGVAGTMYLRNGNQYAGPAAEQVAGDRAEMMSNTAPGAPALEPPAPPPPAVAAPEAAPADPARRDENAGSSYGVRLAEGQAVALDAAKDAKKADSLARAQHAEAAPVVADTSTTRTRFAVKGSGIEVRTPEPQPKELAAERMRKADDGVFAKDERGGAAGPSGGAVPPQDRPASPAETTVAPSDGSSFKAKSPAKPSPRSAVASEAPAAQAAPPPPATPAPELAAQRDARTAAEKSGRFEVSADDKASDGKLDWARKQHREVVALVGSNKCREAASAAIAIYNRAPEYYASNVASDISIKPCLAYVALERQREDRSRAAKRATATEAPAAAAPAPVPAHK